MRPSWGCFGQHAESVASKLVAKGAHDIEADRELGLGYVGKQLAAELGENDFDAAGERLAGSRQVKRLGAAIAHILATLDEAEQAELVEQTYERGALDSQRVS
jgi:UDP-N-acetyl-D-mannosaminuronate dehydrogenase